MLLFIRGKYFVKIMCVFLPSLSPFFQIFFSTICPLMLNFYFPQKCCSIPVLKLYLSLNCMKLERNITTQEM